MTQDKPRPSEKNLFHSAHVQLLARSYRLFTGKNILASDDVEKLSEKIFFAPFAVLSHGTEADPIFNYANQCALQLFEMSWEDFIRLPSRFSAESDSQKERDRILTEVSRHGYTDDYTGVRISNKGRRFQIRNATVWNLVDQDRYYGQAALIREWDFLD